MLQGASPDEADACLEPIREFSELASSFDEPVVTYSAGMRARLGFATALQTQVDVMLIDEVLSVGDKAFREKAAAAMRERIAVADVPVPFKGAAVGMVTAGLMSLAFMGFAGLV